MLQYKKLNNLLCLNKRHYQAVIMLVSPWLCQRVSIVSSSCNVTFFPIAITIFLVFCMGLSIENCNFTTKVCIILFTCIFNCNSLYCPRNCVKVGRHECFGLCGSVSICVHVHYVYASLVWVLVWIFLYLLYIFLIRDCASGLLILW